MKYIVKCPICKTENEIIFNKDDFGNMIERYFCEGCGWCELENRYPQDNKNFDYLKNN